MSHPRRTAALERIARYRDQPLGHFIAGEAVPGIGSSFEVIEPGTGDTLGEAADANAEELDRAVAAAKTAFPAWAKTPGSRRKAILHKVADLIERHAEEIAGVECLDAGQPWRSSAQRVAST